MGRPERGFYDDVRREKDRERELDELRERAAAHDIDYFVKDQQGKKQEKEIQRHESPIDRLAEQFVLIGQRGQR